MLYTAIAALLAVAGANVLEVPLKKVDNSEFVQNFLQKRTLMHASSKNNKGKLQGTGNVVIND